MDFDFLNSPDLSDDFFDDTFKEIANNAPNIVFVNDFDDTLGKPVSGLVTFDYENDALIAGKKFPEEPRYDVVNDPVPAQMVFKWAKGFYENRFKDFPNLPVPSPIIPPSRYESNVGIEAFELKLIGRGFKFLQPTQGQKRNYSTICVDEIKETYVLRDDRNYYNVLKDFSHYGLEEGINAEVLFVSQNVITKKRRKILLEWLKMLEIRTKYIKVLDCPDQYIGFGVPIQLLHQKAEDMMISQKLNYEYIGRNYQVTLTRKEYEEFKDTFKLERSWISKTKYYVRYYSQWKKEKGYKTTALVVGLDFNPYSPYALEVLKSVSIGDKGVEYERSYKEDDIKGFFKFSNKRYHSDVWFPSVFSEQTPYTRDLMSCDLVTNHYWAERVLMIRARFSLLGIPLLIDPFGIGSKKIKCDNRSKLRYRINSDMNKRYVPYMTSSYKISDLPITNVEVVEWDAPITIQYRNGKRDVYYSIPGKHRSDISDYIRWHKNMKKINDIDDYETVMQQYRKYFVVECNEYSHTGKVMVSGKSKNRMNKKTELSKNQYKVWKLREAHDKGPFIKCYQVPYAIRRYPHNVESSIIGDLCHMTLEEAILDVGIIRDLVKDPPWLFEVKRDNNYRGGDSFEFYEE